MTRALVILAAVVLATFGSSPASADERSAPQLLQDRLLVAPQPARDPLDLAVEFRGVSPSTPLIDPVISAPLQPGASQTFWVLDQRSAQLFQTSAALRLVTAHAYWFIQSDMSDRVAQADLQHSADVFESNTYQVIHRYFGSEQIPTVDGGNRIVFLLANVPGVAAYFSSADEYPHAVNPRSNEHEMIYVNLNALRPGTPSFDSTLTHEFQHMTNYAHCHTQEGWVDEGASELAMRVAGYESPPPTAFSTHPDIQLTTWDNLPADVTRHYQAAYLFLRYVAERAGGWSALPTLFGSCARGEALFANFLTRDPIAPDMDSLFSDWTVANLLQDTSVGDGRYGYENGGWHAARTGSVTAQAAFLGSVPQYAANYVDLPTGGGGVTFNGDASVPLLSAPMESGGVWWSNRGDNVDTRLTRRLDLTGVDQATLQFSVWYELEDQFDFAYLSASRDGGRTWQVLQGQHTTPDRSTGNNFGQGWTGSSGGDWLDEQVDLTPFVGSEILLRFDYVTDQSVNLQGFAFKDFRVPQLGLDEPGAAEGPWDPDGWVRVDGSIPERWNLRLVSWTPAGVSVDAVAVDGDGSATITTDPDATRSTLVIAPTAPRTLVPGNYSVTAAP